MGSALVPKLLARGHKVTVFDTYWYGESSEVFPTVQKHPALTEVRGDLRDDRLLADALKGHDAVIHLACVSNDPSFDLDPTLGKSINYDAFRPLLKRVKEAGVRRFIDASSSSVYGVKSEPAVTEDLPLEPITDYGKYKALCEKVLDEERVPELVAVSVRPASVMGYAPRQRLDLTVNIMTTQAVLNKKMTVFGGSQQRPNLHIDDMVDLYLLLLDVPAAHIDGQVFNVNAENETVQGIAERVRNALGGDITIETTPSDDLRSYHTSGEKLQRALGFVPRKKIEDAVRDLAAALADGRLPDALTADRYYNVKQMKKLNVR